MHDDESITTFFLRIYEVFNSMKNIGDEIRMLLLLKIF